jgi:hypothetical protein
MLKFARGFAFIAVVVGLPFLAGCATGPAVSREGPAAEAPTYRVGDRWTYKARDGFGLPVIWDEVHEVTASAPTASRCASRSAVPAWTTRASRTRGARTRARGRGLRRGDARLPAAAASLPVPAQTR